MLTESFRGLAQTLVEMIHTRLEIFELDVRTERIRFLSVFFLGAASFVSLTLGTVMGSVWLVLALGEENRLLTIGIIAVVFVCSGIALMAVSAYKASRISGALACTLAEFEKDRLALLGEKDK